MVPSRFGSYLLLKHLGSGAMGDAHLARPLSGAPPMPPLVVIKRLHPEVNARPQSLLRFRHEAEIATGIDNPHVPRIWDAGQVDDQLYIAMEYVRGWTLLRLQTSLRERGELPPLSCCAEILQGALRGVDALHQARDKDGAPLSVVHRDLSPRNLMLGADGVTRVIDLGLGKSRLQEWRTRTGVTMGTPGYMSPEQVTGEPIDQRSDLFALGVVLWELITGQPYIRRGAVSEMLMASVDPPFVAPSSIRPGVRPVVDQLLKKALSKHPDDRHRTAQAFLAALEAAIPAERPSKVPELIDQFLQAELTQSEHEIRALIEESTTVPELAEVAQPPTVLLGRREEAALFVDLAPAPRPPSTWLRTVGLSAAFAAAIGVGMLIERGRSAPTAPAAGAPPPQPVAAQSVIAVPRAPADAPEEVPETIQPIAQPSSQGKRGSRPPSVPPRPAVEPPPPAPRDPLARDPDESAAEWIDRLIQRAQAKRNGASGPEEARLKDLLVSLNRLAAGGRLEQKTEEIERYARALREIR